MQSDFIQQDIESILQIYSRQPINIDRGEDVYIFDTDGKKYLDFGAGIAVNGLGYSNQKFKNALKAQIDKILHISNLYYNTQALQAASKLCRASRLQKVFFTNSGTEAIEGALKVARRYSYNKGITNPEIIAMNNSFHGRTLGALSVTGNESYQKPFKPLLPGIRFADFNNIQSLESLLNDKTSAIILETIQGEGGVTPASKEFLESIKLICEQRDILLILDEIQCGMGRSGEMFAWQKYNITPDVMTSAKALGCGVPVGAFVLGAKAAQNSLQKGDHGSTYGGNPFACAAVNVVFDLFEELDIVGNVRKLTPHFKQTLDTLMGIYDFLIEQRGEGFLRGIKLDSRIQVKDVINLAREEGLIVLAAGGNVLRFAPPLVIQQEHIQEMSHKLSKALARI